MGKFISIIALLGISVALFMFQIQPRYDHAKEIKVKVERLTSALEKTASIRKLRASLSKKYADFSKENLDRLQKLLPDNVNNVRLILDIDGIASQYGLRLKNVSISESKKPKMKSEVIIGSGNDDLTDYQSRALGFSVTATYSEFKAFLQDLESSLRLLDVVSISMSSANKNPNSFLPGLQSVTEPTYEFSILLKTYWLKSKI